MDPSLFGLLPGTTGQVDPSSAAPVAGQTGVAQGMGVGQHGITPANLVGGGMNAIGIVWDWLNKPFTQPMSPAGVFALVGSVVIAILIWNLILYHIRIAAEAI
jgi:hypothetical protein